MKFGMWHPYTLQMVMRGVSKCRWSPQAHAAHAVHMPLRMNGELHRGI